MTQGVLQSGTGRAAEAEASYQKALDLRKRLAQEHPDVPEYQANLAASYNNLGNLQSGTGRAAEAEASYQKALDLRKRLAQEHPDVPEYQVNLAASYNDLGNLQSGTGRRADAEASYQKALDLYERLQREQPDVPQYASGLALALGNLSYTQLLAGHPHTAIATAQRALDIDNPRQVWIRTNLAHGYLLDNQYDKALAIYTEYKDQKMGSGKTFGEEVLEDFKKLRAKGISHPDMAKIERLLRQDRPLRRTATPE